jgi:hypothetical protein
MGGVHRVNAWDLVSNALIPLQRPSERCDSEGWCFGMRLALLKGHPNRITIGVDCEEPPHPVVSLQTTRRHADGMVLNFCPWCGSRLRPESEKEKEKACAAALEARSKFEADLTGLASSLANQLDGGGFVRSQMIWAFEQGRDAAGGRK